ncbi:FecCD family ABC transporter permease [Allokutzneria oryzae]|uniref:FecCD family ABC transporter permease n=1 Tax=Allokutzneria oryzae TaxID=1378989 RepID=A0ABV6A303_9PSEU
MRTVLLLGTVVVLVLSLALGDYPIPVGEVLAVLTGSPGTGRASYVIMNLRLPRAVGAVLIGACFGLSGAVFQRVARNPLASPDILGVNAGAALAAVLVIVVLSGGPSLVAVGALVGAVVTAVVVYRLGHRSGYKLVLMGIGVTALLTALTSWVLTTAELYSGQLAALWLTGTLAGRSWAHVVPVAVAVAVLFPLVLALARSSRVLELGDEVAAGLGVRPGPARAGLLTAGVALAAVATAAAGPIAFIALVAPQIVRRLGGGLAESAACGALLLSLADLVGRRVFAPVELPVGVLTALLGAPVLVYLLVK